MFTLTFTCPSCHARLPSVEAGQVATEVVKRTCRKCHERWQLVVQPIVAREGFNLHKATFTFLGLTPGQQKVIP